MTAGKAESLRAGVAMALDAMSLGKASQVLADFIEASRG
jgi:anthranilate phosphoribosyltransferase